MMHPSSGWWGKTGVGKSAIVAALTGNEGARDEEGFALRTRNARRFDVPPEAPLVCFFDTWGLEEPGYDVTEDDASIQRFCAKATEISRTSKSGH